MFDFIHNNKRIIQGILVIIFLPFVFFGVDSYFRTIDSSAELGSISGRPISNQEFALAVQQRQNELQRITGGRADAALLASRELRRSALDGLIRQRLLIDEAARARLLISDEQLQQVISAEGAFQENGKFSATRYQEVLKLQNMTPVGFEDGLRRDLMVQRLAEAYGGNAIVPASIAERVLRISLQQREVSEHLLEPAQFEREVKLEAGAAQAYYTGHTAEFQVPEQARLDYVTLSAESIAAQITASAEDVKRYYEQNLKQYAQGDTRQASHILIAVDPKASAQEKDAARAKAEQLLKQARQNPAGFADLARKNSQDPGSATKGGDLGSFARGIMPPSVDAKVFAMRAGEIEGPIESQFGFHIVRLTALNGKGFDEVKQQVEADFKRQQAMKKFSELADQLNNLAFEQGESLKPAADALKIPLRTSGWITRSGGAEKLLNNPKLLTSVFSDDVVKNKRNSEVVDVGGNTLVAARIVEYKAAAVRPLAEVENEITKRLTRERAAQLAGKTGRELLAKLKEGKAAEPAWGAAKTVSRESPQGLPAPEIEALFKADVAKLPAYAGVQNSQGGYVLIRVVRVIDGQALDAAKRKELGERIRQVLGQEQFQAYIESLKLKADVKLRPDALEKKE